MTLPDIQQLSDTLKWGIIGLAAVILILNLAFVGFVFYFVNSNFNKTLEVFEGIIDQFMKNQADSLDKFSTAINRLGEEVATLTAHILSIEEEKTP